MAHKENLRKQRTGTVINNTSEKREGKASAALGKVMLHIINKFSVKLEHESNMYRKDIVANLKRIYPDVDLSYNFETSSMRPDGGILYIVSKNEETWSLPDYVNIVKRPYPN
jgi:type II restriction enzyme